MVTVTVNGEQYNVSNDAAAALFRPPKSGGRVFPVTTKVNSTQRAWLYEEAGRLGITVSALLSNLIIKEMQND